MHAQFKSYSIFTFKKRLILSHWLFVKVLFWSNNLGLRFQSKSRLCIEKKIKITWLIQKVKQLCRFLFLVIANQPNIHIGEVSRGTVLGSGCLHLWHVSGDSDMQKVTPDTWYFFLNYIFFTDLALWAGLVIEWPCPPACHKSCNCQ